MKENNQQLPEEVKEQIEEKQRIESYGSKDGSMARMIATFRKQGAEIGIAWASKQTAQRRDLLGFITSDRFYNSIPAHLNRDEVTPVYAAAPPVEQTQGATEEVKTLWDKMRDAVQTRWNGDERTSSSEADEDYDNAATRCVNVALEFGSLVARSEREAEGPTEEELREEARKAYIENGIEEVLKPVRKKGVAWRMGFAAARKYSRPSPSVAPPARKTTRPETNGSVFGTLLNQAASPSVEAETAAGAEDFASLFNEHTEWTGKMFTEATAVTSIYKLQAEIVELIEALEQGRFDSDGDRAQLLDEYADCFMCLMDSAMRRRVSALDILAALRIKLTKNKGRTWVKNPDNTYSHVKPPAPTQEESPAPLTDSQKMSTKSNSVDIPLVDKFYDAIDDKIESDYGGGIIGRKEAAAACAAIAEAEIGTKIPVEILQEVVGKAAERERVLMDRIADLQARIPTNSPVNG